MTNLRLIPHFQQRLATVNAEANQLQKGTDLRYIQELLGHGSSKTTEIYTHVSRKSLANIKSPLDEIVASQRIENQNIKLNKNK
ncbi:MAG: Tyrosine recombinase XerC [Bacteroidota bacterium]|nr:MAG: Tyrosine recombinase XerC [Bacteroidota bacterium]